MVLEGGQNIIRVHGLAVMELHTLAQVEDPGLGTVLDLPTLRQLRHHGAGLVHLTQVILDGIVYGRRVAVLVGSRIQHIGSGAMRHGSA